MQVNQQAKTFELLDKLMDALLETKYKLDAINDQDSKIPDRNAMARLELSILAKIVPNVQLSVIATL